MGKGIKDLIRQIDYLNPGGIEGEDADLSGDIAENSELDAVVQGSVTDQIGGVGLEQIDAIDGDGGVHLSLAVGVLEETREGGSAQRNSAVHDREPGFPVLDPHLVGVDGGEYHSDVEGQRSGGRVRVRVLGGCGNAHVLDPHLLEIELGLLGLEGEDDDEYHREREQGQEGEEEEEAAAAALEGRRGRRSRVVLRVALAGAWWALSLLTVRS